MQHRSAKRRSRTRFADRGLVPSPRPPSQQQSAVKFSIVIRNEEDQWSQTHGPRAFSQVGKMQICDKLRIRLGCFQHFYCCSNWDFFEIMQYSVLHLLILVSTMRPAEPFLLHTAARAWFWVWDPWSRWSLRHTLSTANACSNSVSQWALKRFKFR